MCLVSYCGCYDNEVVSSALDQMHDFTDWKVSWYKCYSKLHKIDATMTSIVHVYT